MMEKVVTISRDQMTGITGAQFIGIRASGSRART